MTRTKSPWLRIGFDAWSLGLEASSVIGLRTLRIAAGGAVGEAEARRMISEKVGAAVELQADLLSAMPGMTAAGATAKALSHYRRKVRANRRRLSRF
jgi:hypothetical protein